MEEKCGTNEEIIFKFKNETGSLVNFKAICLCAFASSCVQCNSIQFNSIAFSIQVCAIKNFVFFFFLVSHLLFLESYSGSLPLAKSREIKWQFSYAHVVFWSFRFESIEGFNDLKKIYINPNSPIARLPSVSFPSAISPSTISPSPLFTLFR